MANDHTLFEVRSPIRELISLVGNFTASGTLAPTALVGRGLASITRVTTGVYVVGLASIYPAYGYLEAHTVGSGTVPNVLLQCSPPSGKSMTVTSYAVTTGANNGIQTDVPATYQVHLRLDCFNSSVK